MSKSELLVWEYLEHIQQATERFQRYTEDMVEVDFLQNEMVRNAVIELTPKSWTEPWRF
jgi:uncharacterized protein with HEPN domain